jgi:CDP-paratose 2-epimerase
MVESADRPGVGMVAKPGPALRERLGICQWFHYEDYSSLDRAVDLLRELGIRHLRTGISWADYHRPGAEKWYRHVFSALEEFELLVSVWHTPPSISEGNHCASPSRRLADYADFIDQVITNHGASIAAIELWNEPNNTYKWDFLRYDPHWRKFGEMIGAAAYWAKSRGVTTVLGGMMPVDPHWLALMRGYGVLSYIDVIGIHGFPGMWWGDHPNWDWHHHWRGWEEKITCLAQVAAGLPVWVTEAGLATWDLHEGRQGHMDEQSSRLADLVADVTARSYWYSLIDLDPAREAIEGMHVDENEYHLGLVTHEGLRKPAFHLLKGMLSENKL